MTRPEPPLPVPFPSSVSLLTRKPFTNEPLQVIEGCLPNDLLGHAFFIGPGGSLTDPLIPDTDLIQPSHDGTPLFNGDPLIYRIDFNEDSANLTSKIPRTPCFYTDLASIPGEEYADLGYRNHGLARLSFKLGFRNEVNTAFQPMLFDSGQGLRLLITWDAGRPYEVDPESLEAATPVGYNHEWKEQIELALPFGIFTTTAHTAFDPNTDRPDTPPQLFTVNYGKSIGTALRPIFTNEAGEPLPEPVEEIVDDFKRFLDVIEQRVTWLQQPLSTFLDTEKQLLQSVPQEFQAGWQGLRHQVRTIVGQGIHSFKALVVELEDRLPAPLGFTSRPRYLQLLGGLIDLLEEVLEEGFESLFDLLAEVLRLIGIARRLLDAAVKMEDFIHLMVWDGTNPLQQWPVMVEEEGKLVPPRIFQSMHQIAITQDYVVLMDTVFKLGAEQLLTSPAPNFPKLERIIRELLDFKQSDDTTIYIIKRADLTPENKQVVAKRVVIPRSAAHFLADYDTPDGKLTLHLAHNTGWDPAEWTRPYDRFPYSDFPATLGMATGAIDINHLGRYEINGETGELSQSTVLTDFDHTWMTAIFAYAIPDGVSPVRRFRSLYWNSWGCRGDLLSRYIANLYRDYPYREVPVERVLELTREGLPVNLCRLDTETMQIVDRYVFPPGVFGNSAQFVPRRGGSDDQTAGYLMCIVNTSDDPAQSQFWLFDAAHLSKGPVCKLTHPDLAIGMTIHSTWLPRLNPRQASYYVSVPEDYQERIAKIPTPERRQRIEQLFRDRVYPHFPDTAS